MAHSWKSCISELKDREVVWSVGLRGLNDYPLPCPDCSDNEKAEIISSAIGNQTEWVRSVQPNAELITYLWDEGADYYRKGMLHIPEDIHIIFTDEGAGFVRDIDLLKPGSGLYYHTAMLNGQANQLTEMVPPARIYDKGQEFVKKNATFAIILNTSDLRPVPLSTDAVMKFVWNPYEYLQEDPNSTQTKFLTEWSSQKYDVDATSAAKIASAYASYFSTPYISMGRSDHYLANQINGLASGYLSDLKSHGQASKELADKAQTAEPASLPHMSELNVTVTSLASLIPIYRLRFYNSHLVMQVGLHLSALKTIDTLAQSIIESAKGNASGAVSLGNSSLEQLCMLFSYERLGEFDEWRGLYMHDWLVDYHYTRRLLVQTVAQLKKLPLPPIQHRSGYDTFYQYQIVHNNFPYFYYNDTWNGKDVVIVSCSGGGCANSPDGGTFTGETANITMEIIQKVTIRYTIDGSNPSVNSPTYSKPIAITQTTQVKACGFNGKVLLPVLTDVTYHKNG
eukprot:m.68667 g.68667  ORF g.68667 m.68667 type:complete len:510 (+) comp35546_c0_seq1:1007-2536(+)